MKSIHYLSFLALVITLFTSCEEFLDKTPSAMISEKDVFSTYESFQGFFDPNYQEVINYNSHYMSTTMNIGGENYSYLGWSVTLYAYNGDYWKISGISDASTSVFISSEPGYGQSGSGSGVWTGGWRGIRRCNMALNKLPLLTDATSEEIQLIKGQIYFFRAYYHQQIIEAFGGMPYIDTLLNVSEPNHLPRPPYNEVVEKIVADYDRAIALLPKDWDETAYGAKAPTTNVGRATKGTALAYKAKCLLYAASPLMNNVVGNGYVYNVEYAKRAAAAGWEFISTLVPKYYDLVPWSNYSDMFYKQDGTMPWTKETIWQKVRRNYGSGEYSSPLARQVCFPRLGGKYCETTNQTFVDKFEMADGTRYKVEYDSDNAKRWDYRDPRFRKALYVDKDQQGLSPLTVIRMYVGSGSDKGTTQKIALPYIHHKYWPAGCNSIDKIYNNYRFVNPLMRLAEVYLDYAEAVTAAYGADGKAPGATLSAVNAINIVRARAGMPPTSEATAIANGYKSFMEQIWNERTVELCFEGHWWFDQRRWHIGHLPENLPCIDLEFDKNWTPTSFKRVLFKTRVFEDPKHYWLPIPKNLVQQYPEMTQNPGWD